MNKPPLSPINDYVFKRVFGEHLTVLADLLQAVLALPVTEHDICVINPVFSADKKNDKLVPLILRWKHGNTALLMLRSRSKTTKTSGSVFNTTQPACMWTRYAAAMTTRS